MKIISGDFKNRNLKTPKNSKIIRPALAQVREAIFSSLGNIQGDTFLDIFAGTGSLGFEALSLGAEKVYYVDQHPESLSLLHHNAKELGVTDKITVFKRKMPFGLKTLKIDKPLDVVFCDPPYDRNLLNPTLQNLAKQNYIDPKTLIIIEHTKREMPKVAELNIVKEKKFGQTLITYLKKND